MKAKHTFRYLIASILLLAGIAGTAGLIRLKKAGDFAESAPLEDRKIRQSESSNSPLKRNASPPAGQKSQAQFTARSNQSKPATGTIPASDDWVRRTITSEWLDGPDKLVARQRVSIVEADFKYPFLRLEEAVTVDPVSGEENVELIRGSVADHLLLSLKEGVDFNEAADAVRALGYQIRAMEPGSFILAEIPEFEAVTHQRESIKELMTLDEFINHAEPDYLVFPCITPNDPAFTQGKLWGLHNPGNSADATADADIDAPEGWDILKEAPDIVVAVTDTGIQYTHEDLVANMWVHPTNGSHGFDAYDNDNTPMDVGGHGTHCAGTIGASGGNGIGMTGVAWDVQLMALRFLGPNGGATSDAIRVVNYARQNGAHIISASWGGGGYTQGLFDAIKACGDAGIPFVAAAGNSSANNDATPHYPSSYKLPNIVAVASTTKTDKLSNFSCYGRTSVDIGAPGSSIWSTYTGANNSYTFLNGTSMATPHVSGALALAKARFPTEDMASLIDRLYASTDKIAALAGKTSTGGRLNLARLLGGSPPGVFNDHFANAHRIEGHYGSWSGSNAGATRETDENSFSLVGIGNKSVWLAFQTPHTGIVTLDVTNGQFDFEVVVFEGSEKGQLKVVAHSLRNQGYDRTLNFISKPGAEYRVVLDTYLPNPVRWEVEYNLGPPNDLFTDAIPLSGDLFTATGYNRAATSELFERLRPHATRGRGKSVWWTWTAPFSGDFTINTSGSAFDTVLAVYTGSATNTLTEIASNDDRLPLDYSSQVSFPAIEGTTYHIAVDSCHENSFGEIALNGFRSNTLQIIRQPANTTVAVGKRAVLDVAALSATWVSYQWFFNGQAIPGQTAANIVIDPVRSSDFGAYHVEVRNNENLAVSSTATLSESLVAPKLTWTSGSQAVATNTSVTLSATFSGSTPITYSWTKNGQPIPGSTKARPFPSAQLADSGAYRLTATNGAGSATADFTLSVVQSPWDRWEWRLPGVPNAAITDIKVYDGEAFAVSATQLMRSTDGVNWSKSVFPEGFAGSLIAKAGNLLLCLGFDMNYQVRVATSTDDAATWTIQGTNGFSSSGFPGKAMMISYGNAFIACSPNGIEYYRSTNGTSWTRLMTTELGGQVSTLKGVGSFATDGTKLILASNQSSAGFRYHKSADGITWVEHQTTAGEPILGTISPRSAFFDGTKFSLFSDYRIYTSTDGTNWDSHHAPSNPFGERSHFATAGQTLMAFQGNTSTLAFSDDPGSYSSRVIQPSNSHLFTAAATLNGKALYGTDKGLLGIASGPSDVTIPRERVRTLASVEFTENLFIARSLNNGTTSIEDQVSGDGINWRASTPLQAANAAITGSAFGKYYGTRNSLTEIYAGHNPFDVRLAPTDDIGLQPNISFISQLPNGNLLAVVVPSTGSATLNSRGTGISTWATVTSPPFPVDSSLKFTQIGNRWFSSNGTNPGILYTSTNGTTWSSTGITGSNPHFVTMGGRSWCVYQTASSPAVVGAASSTNGTSWSILTTTGFPTGISSPSFIKRMVAFGDYLVVVGSDENIYFSQDGTGWLRGSTPGKVVDIAAGNGQLVAIMKSGGIIQTGTPHRGRSAPFVNIVSPQTASTHLLGSRITVEGTLGDPENGTATYDAYLDAQLISSGTGNSFRLPVIVSDPNGHTFTIRVRDSHGLRQIDSIRLKATPPEPENLLVSGEGTNYLPGNYAAVLDGVFYVASTRNLYRSLDGISWERVVVPDFANTIYAMTSGNGSLVIQFDNGGVMTTRDGINWTHFQPNLTNYWVSEPLRFSAGIFIASYQTPGTTTGSLMTSTDGVHWETGTVSQQGRLSWNASDGNGLILGAPGTGSGANLTADNGHNWIPIPTLSTASRSNSHGIFANGRFIVAFSGSPGRILHSFDGLGWEEYAFPSNISNGPFLAHIGGLYFLGQSSYFSHASPDGITWHPLSHKLHRTRIAHTRGHFVAQTSLGRIFYSNDGFQWAASEDLSSGSSTGLSTIIANEDIFIGIRAYSEVWLSEDGQTWTKVMSGTRESTTVNRTGYSIAAFNDRLVTSGESLLVSSSDDGRTWSNCMIDGLPTNTYKIYHKVVSSDSEILALEGIYLQANNVIRSTDGIHFSSVSGLPSKTWEDLSWNGSEWMLIAADGSLFRSNNGGLTWTEIAGIGLVRGRAIQWFNNRWVIIGETISEVNSTLFAFTLGAGDVLQNHGSIGLSSAFEPVRSIIAHGRLMIWARAENIYVTSNGTSWQAANPRPITASSNYDIYHTPDGFTAFTGSSLASSPVKAWVSDTSGLTWSEVPPPFNNVLFAENLGDRVFLFGPSLISELYDKDLALTMPALSNTSLGVGDEVSANVTIRNFGRTIPPGGTWKVRAWLAKNRFYGDTRNIPLGTFDITDPMPGPGSSQTYPVSFTLPNNIFTGSNYLILSLVTPEHLRESNTANNTTISDTSFVTIPEWEFNVATNGNGQVNRDFAAARYPHKAQVSLTATAGKGAVFTGWAGDAVSPNNQITILMDGNKSLQANFANRAHLQVFIQGAGDVTGIADLGSYSSGQTAQITAVPAPGWEFSHWSGASTESTASTSIIMDAPKSVTAQFVLPLATWKETYFSASQLTDPAVSGDHADFDNDGVTTWQEYLHGSDPTDSKSTGAGPVAISGGFMRRTYTRNLGADQGAGFACRAGRNLISWDASDLQERILSTKDGLETIEAMLPVTGHGEGFLRFEYDDPAP